jgi:hypothetical protein
MASSLRSRGEGGLEGLMKDVWAPKSMRPFPAGNAAVPGGQGLGYHAATSKLAGCR